MSGHLKGYSNYQKRIVKAATELLGERPFSHEKTMNNHLQIKVKGVDRVFHTSSTPSDNRSFENFMADLRGELRRLNQPEPTKPDVPPPSKQRQQERNEKQEALDKITLTIIKKVRIMIEKIRHNENKIFIDHDFTEGEGVDAVKQFRENLVHQELELALKHKGGPTYFTPGMMKQSRQSIAENLDFMLPPLAEYHEMFKGRLTADTVPERVNLDEPDDSAIQTKPLTPPLPTTPCPSTEPNEESHEITLQRLLKEKTHKRLTMIKTLSKNQIALLINDFEKALQQKHQEDIQELVTQIREKGITLDEIQAQLNDG